MNKKKLIVIIIIIIAIVFIFRNCGFQLGDFSIGKNPQLK